MAESQWFGVFLVSLGVYWFVCSIWARESLLYQFKARRVILLFDEPAAHILFGVCGIAMMLFGLCLVFRLL